MSITMSRPLPRRRARRARGDAMRRIGNVLQLLSGSMYDAETEDDEVVPMEDASFSSDTDNDDAEAEFTPNEDETDEGSSDREPPTEESAAGGSTTQNPGPSNSVAAAAAESDIPSTSSGAVGSSAMDLSMGNASFDEGNMCTICFDAYTSDGAHRIVCIACGHLFGQSCIERWIQCSGSRGGGKCPKCKKPVKKKDIRPLYAKLVQMTDTSDLERARKELESIKQEKDQLALELAKQKREHQLEMLRVQQEAGLLQKREGSLLSSQGQDRQPPNYSSLSLSLRGYPIVVCEKKTSRVFASAPGMCLAAATCEFSYQTRVLPPFGLEMVNINYGTKTGRSAKIHQASIRDVKFSPPDERGKCEFILTASMDKTIALTNVESFVRVLKLNVGVACWSCAFNNQNPHLVFAGVGNGTINLYDTRRPTFDTGDRTEVMAEITGGTYGPPFFSMQWVSSAESSVQNSSGLLVASGRKCVFYESLSETVFKPHILFEGPLSSMAFCDQSKSLLLTIRPTSDISCVRHLVSQFAYQNLSNDPEKVISSYSLNTIQEIKGGTLAKNLSRNAIFTNPFHKEQILAAMFDEQSRKISVWKGAEGVQEAAIDPQVPEIMQVECLTVGNRSVLLSLDNHKMRIYDLKTQ